MNKNVLIAGIVGVAAVGIGAYALSRNSGTKQASASGSAFSGFSGGGATGGYSEPTTTDVVKSVLDRVMVNNITPLEELVPEMEGTQNPSDEAADAKQVSSEIQRVYARSGSITQTLTDNGYSLPSQSQSGAAATLMAAASSRAVENENKG